MTFMQNVQSGSAPFHRSSTGSRRKARPAVWLAGLACLLSANIAAAQTVTADQALDRAVADYQALSDARNSNETTGWPDYSPAAIASHAAALGEVRDQLDGLDAGAFEEEDRLTLEILRWKVGLDIEEAAFGTERMPFIAGDGFFTTPTYAAGVTVIRNASDAEAWLHRIAQLPAFYDQAIENMRRGIADGFVQNAGTARSALGMMEAAHALPPEEDPLVTVFETRPPAIEPAAWDEYVERATTLVETGVRPAQGRAIAFFNEDYLPNARDALGASALPDGRAYYAYLVRRNTGSEMTPDEVFAVGEAEIARIRAEMEAEIERAGFDGSFDDFLTYLRTNPDFYPEDLEDALEKAAEIAKRADYLLPGYFELLPRLTYGVRLKPAELEGTSGGYFLGDPEAGIAGSVVMGRNSDQGPLYNLPAWVLHEGVPGHHLQIALGQERDDLPAFRRSDDITVFVEGWALYAERLGVEMGMYETPYENFGRLSFEMWRACRLVMDVGIHWRGWSFDQAADCLRENTALPEHTVEGETRRYIGWPGQALAYKIGEVEIVRLRERAEEALGADFDLRAFHSMLIGSGPMPMSILSDRTDRWIAAQSD